MLNCGMKHVVIVACIRSVFSLEFLLGHWVEASDILDNLCQGLTGLRTEFGIFIGLGLVAQIRRLPQLLDSLLPDDASVINSSQDIQELIS